MNSKDKGNGGIKLYDNEMKLEFSAISQNEAFARVCVASFVTPLNPTVSEITDIKTAVSEAVTNAIIHGYEGYLPDDLMEAKVYLSAAIIGREISIIVEDKGRGIADVEQAMEPCYTSKPEQERSGMGFTVMETFMDKVEVESALSEGTTVTLQKKLSEQEEVPLQRGGDYGQDN